MATDERKTTSRRSSPGTKSASNVPARRDDWSGFWNDPAALWAESPMQRFAREMDRWFHGGSREGRPVSGRSDAGVPMRGWNPEIESFQRGDQFIVRADLPGLSRDQITVNVADDTLTIEGDRRDEHEEHREGFFRSERTYGRFYRSVPLPDGALADTAKASFVNGVLEVTMQAPPREVSRGRRLEIQEPAATSQAPAAPSTTAPTPAPTGTIYPE
jgi:HSP20 family protein